MDTVSAKQRSLIMSKVKSAGNQSTEIKIASIFRSHHISGWRRNYSLRGKPDFVFPKQRVVVFVDGCFWHGCQKHCRIPKSNNRYWKHKIAKNKQHDKDINDILRKQKWKIIRFWEHDLNSKAIIAKLFKNTKGVVHPSILRGQLTAAQKNKKSHKT